jgi:hypothetical protein
MLNNKVMEGNDVGSNNDNEYHTELNIAKCNDHYNAF